MPFGAWTDISVKFETINTGRTATSTCGIILELSVCSDEVSTGNPVFEIGCSISGNIEFNVVQLESIVPGIIGLVLKGLLMGP
jgi:hypothetical protein